jgi:hypothetical protein
MSLLQSLSHGSLFSDESLLQAREGYLPIPAASSAEIAFEQWTKRMTTQHELGIARELAGLSEETLAGLASVFARLPQRRRTDKLRFSFPVGAALLLAGAFVLSLDASLLSSGGTAVSPMQTLAIGCLASGVIAVSIGVLAAFSMMSLDVAHGKLGLCAGLLDEQHPWLYKASLVMRDRAADAYRQRILSERGPLRGIDYLMMREIARANDALEMTRVARTVAEQLKLADATIPGGQTKEPRLVSVPTASADAAEGPGRGVDEPSHAASIRAFGSGVALQESRYR